jgi:hypothetical protein
MIAPLVVIVVAAHVFVGRQGWLRGIGRRQAFEFRLYIAIGKQAGRQQMFTGSFETGMGMFAGQVKNTKTGAIGMLRVWT